VLRYDEFLEKLDEYKPIHHTSFSVLEPRKKEVRSKFRIYGISKAGHLLIFERVFESSAFGGSNPIAVEISNLITQFALPLGSTPGRLAAEVREVRY
jgi:hypothetical protein